MNTKHMMAAFACAAALCGSVQAADAEAEKDSAESKEASQGWNWAMGEGVTYNETPIVSAEVGLAFDSKYLSYGLVDNNDPILTPSAALTFFDWVTLSVESIFDISRYGDAAGYGNRSWQYTELDPGAAIGHSFGPDDASWLPTTIEFEIGYMYEAHPAVTGPDTQFVTLTVALPDLWFEPAFQYEQDIQRDEGAYLNLEIGHTFALVEGVEEGDDDILDLRVSAAQGWGNKRRIRGYLPDIHNVEVDDEGNEEYGALNHEGLMDTTVKVEMTWNITDGVALSGYVAYVDYLLDPSTREASRHYEATGAWTDSYNFVAGAAISFAF